MREDKGNASDILGHYEMVMKLQKAVIGCLVAFIVILIGICAYLGTLPKSVPWVIELTQDGEATYYPDAVKLLENWSPNETTQRYFMMDYVINLRSISTDNYVNKDNAQKVFNKTLSRATDKGGALHHPVQPDPVAGDMEGDGVSQDGSCDSRRRPVPGHLHSGVLYARQRACAP